MKTEQEVYLLLAEALRYPAPGRLEQLEAALPELPAGPAQKSFAAFVKHIQQLSLGEWEELHTHTLDLNPPGAPYVGFQVWGESYQRGSFLSRLNRSLYECDVDPDGELPDHLVPVLRYLAVAGQPLAELCAALPQALERMSRALRKVEPRNPYLQLFAAVSHACQALPQAEEQATSGG